MQKYILFTIICCAAVFGFGAYNNGLLFNNLNNPSVNEVINEPDPVDTFNEPPVEFPQTGIYKLNTSSESIAPLTIKTDATVGNYFIKLTDVGTNIDVVTLFIKYGETASLNVPLGTYKIKSATGDVWYGDEFLFGPLTNYSEIRDLISFTKDGNQINGCTLTLIGQIDGNLPTDTINKDNW